MCFIAGPQQRHDARSSQRQVHACSDDLLTRSAVLQGSRPARVERPVVYEDPQWGCALGDHGPCDLEGTSETVHATSSVWCEWWNVVWDVHSNECCCDVCGWNVASEVVFTFTCPTSSVVTIPDFAMRYVSRYLGQDAIRIAILVYRIIQCLDLQFVYDGNAIYWPRYTLPNHHNMCRMC